MKGFLWIICIIWVSFLVKQTYSITVYYGDPKVIQKLVTDAIEGGFVEVKNAIDKQFWFMLRQAKFDKYSFKIKSEIIEYQVNYTSVENIFEFNVNLSKFTWRPQIVSNKKYLLDISQINSDLPQSTIPDNHIDKQQINSIKTDQNTQQLTIKIQQNNNMSQKSQSNLKTPDNPKQSTSIKIIFQNSSIKTQQSTNQSGSVPL